MGWTWRSGPLLARPVVRPAERRRAGARAERKSDGYRYLEILLKEETVEERALHKEGEEEEEEEEEEDDMWMGARNQKKK